MDLAGLMNGIHPLRSDGWAAGAALKAIATGLLQHPTGL